MFEETIGWKGRKGNMTIHQTYVMIIWNVNLAYKWT